ncbi:Lysophosphatidic acid:oleoyl-CoA acyltransferase 1, partial [Neurospora sp. IMI 360204]
MEKFSQFRDRGSGISPFMPSPAPESSLPSRLFGPLIFLLRLPFFLLYTISYFLLLPLLPSPLRKLLLWGIFALTGTWWSDLQLDGVKRGSLSQQPPTRIPRAGTVIAANFTSPLDAVYLAAVWD